MVIKKYLVNNMNEALTRIRYELGRDAVIIGQRKVKKPGIKGFFTGKKIEVTAAVENFNKDIKEVKDNKEETQKVKDSIKDIQKIMNAELELKSKEKEDNKFNNLEPKIIEKEDIKDISLENEMKDVKKLLNEVLKNTSKEELTSEPKEDKLLTLVRDLDIDLEFYDELKERVSNDRVQDDLKEAVKSSIEISKEDLRGNIVLIGPTGVGKTTTIAKLAGRLALIENKKVGLITIDTYRIGAVEQLKTYAEIMNIPFKVVITTKEMEQAVESMSDCDVVLIDTTGRSSKNSMQISELRAYVEKANPDSIAVVISATTKNKDIKIILDGYSQLNYDRVIITKLDETSTYGSLYNISKRANKPLKFITVGQNVPDDIKEPTKEDIINFIFGEEALC